MQIEQFGGADAGASIADAGATVLMQQVYDTLTSGEPIDFDTFSKIISRLRSGDHRLRELNAKLAEYKRREEEWQRIEAERKAALAEIARKARGRKITPEFLDELQREMGLK